MIDEVFLGDYVLIGGELVVMVMVDVIVCFVFGVLGNMFFLMGDLFFNGLFEYL